ncbi:LOW QUALITY PROTEIN: LEAF RUST 10 DISEASE-RESISTANCEUS RECEPTOR-LIKE PROTEIN KINASE-like 2.4 [Primulina eburnea]|uniref:LOW QUALITY PROTEIN: LEAF RUST 10 DISEASE-RESISTANCEUS RECEPTOR-LIKE PROTEIN KINASE-like 2.4 n=1 Tax=Primulina eburnea TaxID=1245227 RepID=UPI003C6C35AF
MSSSAIVLLHTFTCTSWILALALVNGATFTVVNNCTQTIWPVISGNPSLNSTGFELPKGGNRVLQVPNGWVGRLWGRTGCVFDANGKGSCSTGDCGSGQIECNGTNFGDSTATLAELSIDSLNSMDFYDISLVNGFNLPMIIDAIGRSGQHCQSTGCTEDINRLCPADLRTKSGDACQNKCKATGTQGSSVCGLTNYLQLFKNTCPMAFIFPTDDANAVFTCTAGDYVITFCPSELSMQNETCSQPFQCGSITNISYPFWGANRPRNCGFPGFQLTNCESNVPLLTIASRAYRVLGIDHSSQTLQVARQDLWDNTCPSVLYNTTLDPNLFSFPQNYIYKKVTLYYDCISVPVDNNQFTCYTDGIKTLNYFVGEEASEIGSNLTCSNSISVPVNPSAAKALSNHSALPNDLKDALAKGFSIQWLNTIASCQGCVRSGGVCGYHLDSALLSCDIANNVLAVAPTKGSAPALSPGPSPFHNTNDGDQFYHTDPGYGESGLSRVKKVLIGMAVTVAVVAVVAAFVISYIRRKRRFKRSQLVLNQETNPNVENFLFKHEYLAPKKYKYSQIKKITKSFSEELGHGGYGSVYKGTLPNGQFVAVKLLTETKSNGEDFINEVASISRTSHVNIVNLLGFCYEKNRRALVYEFMPNKSLDKFISTNESLSTNCSLDWETLSKIAVGIARGLEYLHKGCNTRIVHFDIKPQNILLDEDFCPKISDFGLAKLCKKKQSILSMAGTRGTIGYIAPEVFSRNFGGVSHKSDVYSYGMMILEMAGARNIVGLGQCQSSENYFPDKIYEQVILHETENVEADASEKEEATRKMFLVGFWCIQTIPSDRPSMSKVVEMLEGSLDSIQIPPKPYLFTPASLGQELSPSVSGNAEIESSIEESITIS